MPRRSNGVSMRKTMKRISASGTLALITGIVLAVGPALAEVPELEEVPETTLTETPQSGADEIESEEDTLIVEGPDAAEAPDERTPTLLRTGTSADPGLKPYCPDPVFMVYYRTWRDVMMPHNANSDLPDPNVIAMTDLPYGVNIVSLFHYVDPSKGIDQDPFWETVRNVYVPEMHERGAKVIRTIDIGELFKPIYGLTADSTPQEFDAAAQQLLETYVTDDGIDGLDIDMERNLSQDQQVILGGVYEALSKYLGPLSGTGKLLVYDTNRYAENSYIEQVAPYIDYLFYQSYGAKAPRLDTAINGYSSYISSCQFLPGYTSPEELDNNRWYDTVGPIWESNAIAMARWQPEGGQKGGIFQYAIDRDGMTYDEPDISTIRPTTFEYAKRVIAIVKYVQFDQDKAEGVQTVNGLPALTADQRALFTQQIQGAETFEQVFEAIGEAIETSEQNEATALAEAKEKAVAEINGMKGLSAKDRDAALAAIAAATSIDEVNAALQTARDAVEKPATGEGEEGAKPAPSKPGGELPKTGADIALAFAGIGTLTLGAAAFAVARRRQMR